MSTYSMDTGQLCPAHSHLSLTAGVLFKCLHTQWTQDSYAQITVTYHLTAGVLFKCLHTQWTQDSYAQITVTYHLLLECCLNVYILNGRRTVMPSSQSLITYCWSAVQMSTYAMDAGQLCPDHSHLSLTAGVLLLNMSQSSDY